MQNIHLVAKWLPKLEKQLEQYSTGSHDSYRVFMSAEPAPIPESHIIPQVMYELHVLHLEVRHITIKVHLTFIPFRLKELNTYNNYVLLFRVYWSLL